MAEAVSKIKPVSERIAACDWPQLATQLDEQGYALTPPLLTPEECAGLVRLYADSRAFRKQVVMARHNFGRGEYQFSTIR